MKIRTILGASLLLLVSVQVNAALTSIDWKTTGDGLITRDDNGLEWLDVSETMGRSYNDVSSKLGSGQEFDGFRYSTRDELAGLWDSAGGDNNFYDGTSTQNDGLFDILAPYLSENLPANRPDLGTPWNGYAIIGAHCAPIPSLCATWEGGDQQWYSVMSPDINSSNNPETDFFYIDNGWIKNDTSRPVYASGLVRVSEVPIPAAIWLFGTALIGLVGFGKRRKAA